MIKAIRILGAIIALLAVDWLIAGWFHRYPDMFPFGETIGLWLVEVFPTYTQDQMAVVEFFLVHLFSLVLALILLLGAFRIVKLPSGKD